MSLSDDVRLANARIRALIGRELSEFRMGFGLRLDFGDGWLVTIETDLSVTGGDKTFSGDPVSGDAAAALIPLRLRKVSSAQVSPDGSLTIATDGGSVSVSPHPDYESWQVSGPGGSLVVCAPSADYIAVWTDAGQPGTHGVRYTGGDLEG